MQRHQVHRGWSSALHMNVNRITLCWARVLSCTFAEVRVYPTRRRTRWSRSQLAFRPVSGIPVGQTRQQRAQLRRHSNDRTRDDERRWHGRCRAVEQIDWWSVLASELATACQLGVPAVGLNSFRGFAAKVCRVDCCLFKLTRCISLL